MPSAVTSFQLTAKESHERVDYPQSWENRGDQLYKDLCTTLALEYQSPARVIIVEGDDPNIAVEASLQTLKQVFEADMGGSKVEALLIDASTYRLTLNVFERLQSYLLEKLASGQVLGLIFIVPSNFFVQSDLVNEGFDKAKIEQGKYLIVEPDGQHRAYGSDDFVDSLPISFHVFTDYSEIAGQSQFTREVLRLSERWLGHYGLKGKRHVRTHYNLYNKITKVNYLYRYLIGQVHDIFAAVGGRPDAMVGFGLHHVELEQVLGALSNEFECRELIYHQSTRSSIHLPSGSSILLISDTVLTGSLAKEVTKFLEEELGHRVIGLLTLMSLSNSATSFANDKKITSLARIRRPFYEPAVTKDSCPMCNFKCPCSQIKVNDDFYKIPDRLNPYDFWEAVIESKSFSHEHQVISGRHFTYFIDMRKMARMYAEPFSRQLVNQIVNSLGNLKPNLAFYISDGAVAEYRNQLEKMMSGYLPGVEFHGIESRYLEDFASSKEFKWPESLDGRNLAGQCAIIFDVASSSFETFRRFSKLLQRMHVYPAMFAVFLNRASLRRTNVFKSEHPGTVFESLFDWPVRVFDDKDDCPECKQNG